MILFKNRLILGGIKKVIKTIFSFIYKILKFFNLQLTLLVILVGVVLFFAGVFEGNAILEMLFFIILIASIFYGVVATINKILSPKKQDDNKRSKVEIIKSDDGEVSANAEELNAQNSENSFAFSEPTCAIDKPKYYKVKQNPNFVMAEYLDRFELYEKTEKGLKKVRTDYKENLR